MLKAKRKRASQTETDTNATRQRLWQVIIVNPDSIEDNRYLTIRARRAYEAALVGSAIMLIEYPSWEVESVLQIFTQDPGGSELDGEPILDYEQFFQSLKLEEKNLDPKLRALYRGDQ